MRDEVRSACTPGEDIVVRVEELRVRYGDRDAVAGISFEVCHGEVFALLGPNGAGRIRALDGVDLDVDQTARTASPSPPSPPGTSPVDPRAVPAERLALGEIDIEDHRAVSPGASGQTPKLS